MIEVKDNNSELKILYKYYECEKAVVIFSMNNNTFKVHITSGGNLHIYKLGDCGYYEICEGNELNGFCVRSYNMHKYGDVYKYYAECLELSKEYIIKVFG